MIVISKNEKEFLNHVSTHFVWESIALGTKYLRMDQVKYVEDSL